MFEPSSTLEPADVLELSQTTADAADLLAEWSALADRVDAPPFLHPGWIAAWADAFGVESLQLIAVRRDGELVAVMPMDRRSGSLHAPANSHSPLFGPLALDDDARDELLRRLFDAPCTSVELDVLDGSASALDPIADTAREEGMLVLSRTVARSPYIPLQGSFEDFERGLSRNRRRGLGRQLRRLEGEGAVAFEIHDGRERLDDLLDEILAVEASGWKGDRGTAIASSLATRRFYSDVAHWAARRGWLRLAFLRLDGRPIACDFALEHGGSWYTLKAGYDERLRPFGPGALLLRFEVEHCYEQGLARLDLLGNEDPFKASWTNHCGERVWLRAFKRSPRGVAAWSVLATRERLRDLGARALRSTHAVEAWLVLQTAAGAA
jgi:CelD/BcsL family acetyltransferase involved in cellulose biosynthesis